MALISFPPSERKPSTDRCWQIPELVQLICEAVAALDERSNGAPATRTIAALAATSRRVWYLAIPSVWREQTSLIPLLKCMPSDLLQETVVNGRKTFVLDTTAAMGDGPVMGPEVYRMLSACVPRSSLLPNLETLFWQMEEGYSQLFFARFVGAKVTSVRLYRGVARVDAGDASPTLFLLALADSCPSVEELALASYDADFLCDIIGNCWHTLSSLTLSSLELSPRSMGNISELPNLVVLHLAVVDPQLPVTFTSPGFRSLEALYLYVPSMEVLTEVLQMSGVFSLSTVHIAAHTPSRASSWERLVEDICEHCSPTMLTSLLLVEETLDNSARVVIQPDAVDSYVLGRQCLRPLFEFPNLCSVTIQPYCGFDLNDVDVKVMAQAWRKATDLDLTSFSKPVRPPRVTLNGLVSLAFYCPMLDYLRFVFDGTVLLSKLDPARLPRLQSNCLDFIHFAHSPVRDARITAAFLAVLFPGLQNIGWADDEGDDMTERERIWSEVQGLLEDTKFREGARELLRVDKV
ncbi:hypothetical protein FISHEDRAFT_68189 [Fistulina hepatica ATCC 64428]|uniref:F-box domain-containing protein n=1 Tax=Fistulina hepatica ATCC 64428 TaxID=1128425 RepID=A0A0D7A2I2_9AGAR|nr:hypothetical protein FISHEDRAFT_68189 [Fistulina hepatica ATCC 64428]